MVEEVSVRYTKLPNGNWVIEATSQVPITVISGAMEFIDTSGQKHTVSKLMTPEGHPEAPYYFFVEAKVTD